MQSVNQEIVWSCWLALTKLRAPVLAHLKEYVHVERKRGGGRRFFTQIEPNWPLPYTVPCQYNGWGMPGRRRAGSPIVVYARVQCPEPKTGQEKVQFYCKDHLIIIYLWPTSSGVALLFRTISLQYVIIF